MLVMEDINTVRSRCQKMICIFHQGSKSDFRKDYLRVICQIGAGKGEKRSAQ